MSKSEELWEDYLAAQHLVMLTATCLAEESRQLEKRLEDTEAARLELIALFNQQEAKISAQRLENKQLIKEVDRLGARLYAATEGERDNEQNRTESSIGSVKTGDTGNQ